MNVWLDTNVLVRFVTRDDAEQSKRVLNVMRRAERGEMSLRVSAVVVAEVIWVLESFYGYEPAAIADALRALVIADGVAVEEQDVVMEALRLMQEGAAYTDAYVAALARSHREPVFTLDADFKRLGVELFA
ncbi:MAG TPA: type II toxin-antitoxin system VapC family toxin [Verrucomicrobiae bacterium]|nr:type II toxin-antitoxin system VapC family toxin [Verrucomicrobiae bacterium]